MVWNLFELRHIGDLPREGDRGGPVAVLLRWPVPVQLRLSENLGEELAQILLTTVFQEENVSIFYLTL